MMIPFGLTGSSSLIAAYSEEITIMTQACTGSSGEGKTCPSLENLGGIDIEVCTI